jgi:hypothetical protein
VALDLETVEEAGVGRFAVEDADGVAPRQQFAGGVVADEAGGAQNQSAHPCLILWSGIRLLDGRVLQLILFEGFIFRLWIERPMAESPNGKLTWDVKEIAGALKIRPEDVREYFTDGRRASFIIERRLCFEFLGGSLAESEGQGFDVRDRRGRKWEIRSITKGGVYFCPSYMVGKGRTFNEQGFLRKMDDIVGYVVADVASFPDVPFWTIPVTDVRSWWKEGKLGSTTKVSRKKALELLQIRSHLRL